MRQQTSVRLGLGILLGIVLTASIMGYGSVRTIGARLFVGSAASWPEWYGSSQLQRDHLFSQVMSCLRTALGADVFDELIVEAARQPNPGEWEAINFCQSDTQGPGDMPVYDLRRVYKPLQHQRKYPPTVLGTSGQSWFELMELLDNDAEVDRLKRAGINTIAFTVL